MSREIGQSRWHGWWINGGLLVLALVSLAPLLWMVSVSVMPAGEATTFPPPLTPSHVTFANYHELFARTGMGVNFANSLLVSVAITLGSLLLNTMAGYAFAKLRFVGRDRL
ncbi:MAG: carbohydrate ABC transporter permease, partial [Stenotrophomonas sp.]|nr:carbohydrate ABC transporter permease [Stenotrophomonas sp.]